MKILSIYSVYADRIRDGTKVIELRGYNPHILPGSWTLLYETKPTQIIKSAFRSSGFICMNPDDLWHQYHEGMGISRGAYDAYFEGKAYAYGVMIEDVVEFDSIPYQQLRKEIDFKAPQGCNSWNYDQIYGRVLDAILAKHELF